jgi:signal transduction histidine kinase
VKLSRWARSRGPAALAAVVGTILTVVAAYSAWIHDRDQQRAELDRKGVMAVRLVEETVSLAQSKVNGIQAFLQASSSVSAVEFSRFALYQGGSPGMVYLGFARIVTEDEWQDFMTRAQEGRTHYVVLDESRRPMLRPPSDRDVVAVWYSHQPSGIPTILGLDLAASPLRREAIDRSRASGLTSVTELKSMLGGQGERYVDFYAPVHGNAGGGPGVAFVTIDLFALLNETSEGALDDMEVAVYDVTDAPPETPALSNSHWSRRIHAADRIWEVVIGTNRPAALAPLVLTVLAAGLAITALVAIVTGMVVASRKRRRELEDLKEITRAKDVFLASVAHELRTPLTSVVGITALLSEGWQGMDRHEVDELLTTAYAEANDLGYLIDDLLVAGRLQAGAIHYRSEAVDVGEEIRRVLARINPVATVVVDLPPSGPVAHADPLRVRQIVRNIVVNGLRYARNELRVDHETAGAEIVIRIRNDGPPIPRQLEEVLFRPYQEGSDRPIQKGSIGLGLPVSKTLARAMGGDLTYSYEKDWCVFTIRLPAWQEDATIDTLESTTRV